MQHPDNDPAGRALRGSEPGTPLGAAQGFAAGIASTLRMARSLAASGRRIDLTGLDGPIGILCAKSLDLPPEQGQRMRLVLIALLEDLEALTETMRMAGDIAGTA